ncbi:MAG: TetR/AcrR family transcriptional regulator [Thermodesulfobacteriota bacterium]
MPKTRTKRPRLTGEERRAQIINAALKIFAQKGFKGARTKEIASEAEISETLVFQHFKTKNQLYLESLAELFQGHPFETELGVKMTKKNDYEVFHHLAHHFIKHSRADDRIMRLILYSGLEGLDLFRDHDEQQVLSGYIRRRIEDGVFKDLNPDLVARIFLGTVFMYAADLQLNLGGPNLDSSDEQAVETIVTIFLSGLQVVSEVK